MGWNDQVSHHFHPLVAVHVGVRATGVPRIVDLPFER